MLRAGFLRSTAARLLTVVLLLQAALVYGFARKRGDSREPAVERDAATIRFMAASAGRRR